MIFLDTHAVIWIYQGDKNRFSPAGFKLLEEENLFVSPAVILELEYLFETGRITQRGNVLREELTGKGILSVDDIPFDNLSSKAMELKWTRDPFDRLITAQAAIRGSQLLTRDTTITKHYHKAVW